MKTIKYDASHKGHGIELVQKIDLGDVEGEPKQHIDTVFFESEDEFHLFKKAQLEALESQKEDLTLQLKEVKAILANFEKLEINKVS